MTAGEQELPPPLLFQVRHLEQQELPPPLLFQVAYLAYWAGLYVVYIWIAQLMPVLVAIAFLAVFYQVLTEIR